MIETLIDAAKTLVAVVTPLNLVIVSFVEAIFFPIPPDVVLIPLVLMRPEGGLWFALIATISSVLGALCGYLVGWKGGRPLLRRLTSPGRFQQAEALLNTYDVWAIAIGAFTPVPYKVMALAAGAFRINLWRFALISLFGRGTRFTLIALLLMLFGAPMAEFVRRHFEWITVGLTLTALLAAALYRLAASKRKRS